MNVNIVTIPYDSGHRGLRMGRGPLHFIERGLVKTLTSAGYAVATSPLESAQTFRTEVSTAMELNRLLAAHLGTLDGQFPLILSGNCNLTLAALVHAGSSRTGLIWFDAHGDYNTPETSPTGFFDGMGLAVITGQCWQRAAATVNGYAPVPPQHVIHVGGRDFDPGEMEKMQQDGVSVVPAANIRRQNVQDAVTPALRQLGSKVDQIHIHMDLDVLDPLVAQANHYAPPDGLNLDQVHQVLAEAARHFRIVSVTFSAYDPDHDSEDKTLNAGRTLMQTILEFAQGQ